MPRTTPPDIIISATSEILLKFTTLLQSGIKIKCNQGTTVGAFLHTLPQFSMDYITEKIETIFLDGTPVDDLETQFSNKHQTLALSAAMPGLAGAILRRNSFHAALRSISTKKSATCDPSQQTTVLLKLFNTIARERGPALLQAGITISSERLDRFLTTRHTLFEKIISTECSGQRITEPELIRLLQDTPDVVLTICVQND